MRRKQLFLAAVLLAVAVTGCKKKETIDLSSLHTSQASESQEEASKSSEPETVLDLSDSTEETSASETVSGITASMETYAEGGVTIQYPSVSNLPDEALEKQVNDLIRSNATAIVGAKGLPKEGSSLSVSATVESSNRQRLVISYKGELKNGSDTERIFYSNTVDLETGKNLRLPDYADAYTIAGYLASGEYSFAEAPKGEEAAVRSYINGEKRDTDYYYQKLTAADFSDSGSHPEYFSFERQGVIFVSVPVSHELGDYALVKYSPDNK